MIIRLRQKLLILVAELGENLTLLCIISEITNYCLFHLEHLWANQNHADFKIKHSPNQEGTNCTTPQICSSSHSDRLQSHLSDYMCVSHFAQPFMVTMWLKTAFKSAGRIGVAE